MRTQDDAAVDEVIRGPAVEVGTQDAGVVVQVEAEAAFRS